MKRIVWIDIIKGMLLLLICLSHSGSHLQGILAITKPTSNYWVPIFFLLSGFLFNNNTQSSFKSYLSRKTRTLLIPYLCFSLLFVAADWNTYLHPSSIPDNLYKIFIVGNGPFKASPLWFIMVLFLSSICIRPIIKATGNLQAAGIAILTSLIALWMSAVKAELPLLLHLVPSAVTYMLAGYSLKQWLSAHEREVFSIKLYVPLSLFNLWGGVIGMFFIKLGDFHFNQIESYPLFYLSPLFFGAFLILLFSMTERRIARWTSFVKPFLWISRNGIAVLSVHVYLIICSGIVTKALNITNEYANFAVTFIGTAAGLGLAVPLLNKYFPWMVGKTTNS